MLLAVAAIVGWRAQAENARQVAAARQADRTAWLDQGSRNPHSAAHFGQYAFKPTSPLTWVDRGVDAETGVALWMEAHYQDPASFRPAADRTALARFGELTAATVLRLLVPLIIVLIAFGAVAGERERGTWRHQLAQGARARDLVLGKLIGLGGALLVPLVPVALLGAAGLVVAGGTTGLPDLGDGPLCSPSATSSTSSPGSASRSRSQPWRPPRVPPCSSSSDCGWPTVCCRRGWRPTSPSGSFRRPRRASSGSLCSAT
ncbi:MAG: ABC transporter permease [Thermoanaerobaculia bacterium]